jgi:hypothetical protein
LVILVAKLEADRSLADMGSRLLLNDLEGVVQTEVKLDGLVLLLRLKADLIRFSELSARLLRDLVLEDGRRVLCKSHLLAGGSGHVNDVSIPGLQLVAAFLSAVDTEVEDLTGGELTLTHDARVRAFLLTVPARVQTGGRISVIFINVNVRIRAEGISNDFKREMLVGSVDVTRQLHLVVFR